MEGGAKLVVSQDLLHDLRVTAGTLWSHVIQERPNGRGRESCSAIQMFITMLTTSKILLTYGEYEYPLT